MTRNPFADGEPFSANALNSMNNAHANEGVVEGLGLSIGSGDWEVDVSGGRIMYGDDIVDIDGETVELSESGAEDRLDLITADSEGMSVTEGDEANDSGQPDAPPIPDGEVVAGLVYVRDESDEILRGDLHEEYKTLIGVVSPGIIEPQGSESSLNAGELEGRDIEGVADYVLDGNPLRLYRFAEYRDETTTDAADLGDWSFPDIETGDEVMGIVDEDTEVRDEGYQDETTNSDPPEWVEDSSYTGGGYWTFTINASGTGSGGQMIAEVDLSSYNAVEIEWASGGGTLYVDGSEVDSGSGGVIIADTSDISGTVEISIGDTTGSTTDSVLELFEVNEYTGNCFGTDEGSVTVTGDETFSLYGEASVTFDPPSSLHEWQFLTGEYDSDGSNLELEATDSNGESIDLDTDPFDDISETDGAVEFEMSVERDNHDQTPSFDEVFTVWVDEINL